MGVNVASGEFMPFNGEVMLDVADLWCGKVLSVNNRVIVVAVESLLFYL